ncbi:HRDC domain-containing protein [Propionimicrobium sp. PCR01-08-3]|uniref:HRDC domain-containing protein n=1 Tax=Propionimicrobium sp. PCR01-08-3 TaxID=3052086 RepID=UPI00255C2D1D|nr:HRDC domain-containing protein [Propionimicrobium sp. PCR01-08-3]WIY81401.1 HRDC domain-containing protein [Propionimicrobium sp. PCR01-08-3]
MSSAPAPELDDLPVLAAPVGGVPTVTDTPRARSAAIAALQAGTGAVAIDVERAQSFRYSGKAYLLQLKRPGSGIILIDPEAFESAEAEVAHLAALQKLIGDEEWIIHAATQDLPNLVQLGLRPTRLFDTELAGRLLGLPKVGLAALVGRYCGVRLLKEHAAADWSKRPIPGEWLTYAALDVELLHELRVQLLAELTEAGKQEWARQEFEWLCRWAVRPIASQPDPWRRTSGSHHVHTPRGQAIVRELWTVRDKLAREADKAPSKIVQDKAISELASFVTRDHPAVPGVRELRLVDGFKRRQARAHQANWLAALDRVAQLPKNELPPVRGSNAGNGIPAPRNWERLNPDAWHRWERVRPAVVALAADLNLPVENLISPDALKHVLWGLDAGLSTESVSAQLAGRDARPWQQELVAPVIVGKLA